MKQEIISYRKIIKPERSTLRVLERRVEAFLPEELELYFDDIVDAAERIWDLLDNYKEVVEGLESTNESVIAHKQGDVLRILTVIATIALPLTLIASLFGMNVLFPGEGSESAFWVILGVMIATLVAHGRDLPLEELDLAIRRSLLVPEEVAVPGHAVGRPCKDSDLLMEARHHSVPREDGSELGPTSWVLPILVVSCVVFWVVVASVVARTL